MAAINKVQPGDTIGGSLLYEMTHVFRPAALWGGGVRSKSKRLTMEALYDAVSLEGKQIDFTHYQYMLKSIMRLDDLILAAEEELAPAIACHLPMSVVIPYLNVDELKDLCNLHGIKSTTLHGRDTIVNALLQHECVEDICERWGVILQPARKEKTDLFPVTSDTFLNSCKPWSNEVLHPLAPGSIPLHPRATMRLHAVHESNDKRIPNTDGALCITNVPLSELVKRLTVNGMRALALHHGLHLPPSIAKPKAMQTLVKHVCTACPPLDFFFVTTSSTVKKRSISSMASQNSDYVWPPYESKQKEPYPPRPTTVKDVAKAMQKYCAALRPEAIEEDGCACCAQLTPKLDLQPFTPELYDESILCEPGVSRLECRTTSEPYREIGGPLYIAGKPCICKQCHAQLRDGLRPQMSLANHLWLGDVPPVLKDLTLAEQSLISRVRYNRCVVRISSGHAKMIANVIAFEHPTMKIYNRLPITPPELDEILAVVFTGVNPPSEEDLKRTPVLVRRAKVRKALEWLKVNNKLYDDLEIDYTTLNGYPENGVPVGVLYNKTTPEEGNVPDTAKSQFDDDAELGTSSGPCPFTVHGLTSERFTAMSTMQRKAAAIQHLKNYGSFLAVGHQDTPQSIYDNPSLYPKMFPWLFPYGCGGVGQLVHKGKIAKEKHLKWLLMYYDKRFQEDAGFIIVAFNHQLIKQGTLGSFMMVKRGNFLKVADAIANLNPSVLAAISHRMENGERVIPETTQEKLCFSLLDQIEYVGSHIDGSIASKKYQRNELWSLVSFENAPNWFVTSSFVDNKHPLCLYFADHNICFKPEIKGYAERQHLITRNPVACARFFDYLVKLFIQYLCGWSSEGPTRGLYGKPAAYYGTVEQQGRMTLHLHCLIWIEGSPSPQDLREKLMSEDSDFQRAIIAYLESCQTGEFLTGTKEEVTKRVPLPPKNKDKGIHTILVEEDEHNQVPENYNDPTMTLPEAPPDVSCDASEVCGCENCSEVSSWYERFKATVDDLLLRSNMHRCFGRRDINEKVQPKSGRQTNTPKTHATGKGCINQDGICTARFPRTLFEESFIDMNDGHINLKKREEWMNNVTPAVTAASRCNTDTTCLLSGTAIKATIGYVTDYITKAWLKTHQVFSTMYNSFNKNVDILQEEKKSALNARKMIIKIVNSLSAKMEIGAPMAAVYLLDNPDRYCSHEFVPFYWKNFVTYVEEEWKILAGHADPEEIVVGYDGEQQTADEGVERTGKCELNPDNMGDLRGEQTIQIRRTNSSFVGKSSTDDYRFRPTQHSDVNLYEWIQCSIRHKASQKRTPAGRQPFFQYLPQHPMAETHLVACDPGRRTFVVPNFIGPAMPRPDTGDREVYCCTMLVFFCPWRTGVDLKSSTETWEEAFNRYAFTPRQRQVMANLNIRYECYDARDDFGAQYRSSGNANNDSDEDGEDDAEGIDVEGGDDLPETDDVPDSELQSGPAFKKLLIQQEDTLSALRHAGWSEFNGTQKSLRNQMALPRIVVDEDMTPTAWRAIVRAQRLLQWRRRFAAAEVSTDNTQDWGKRKTVPNDAYVVPASFISKDFVPAVPGAGDLMAQTVQDMKLNKDQERAFRIVANHATSVGPEQLLMYLGGMGGTGKSRVIRSLEKFFKARGEPYRFILLAPTGTAAALIGGTTYHSFLGLRTGKGSGDEYGSIGDLIDRLRMVGYILLDEVSMVNSVNLCRISARLCEALQVFEVPFGGLNVILAGDFAQLPPAGSIEPLYSGAIPLHQSPRQFGLTQEKIIGRTIWMQFTTVVVLKENMRQVGDNPQEVAFRQALVNLRYHACTEQDIALLRSRIAGPHTGLSVDQGLFKNVAIITARNLDKDQFNASQSVRFARENGYELHHFHSLDKLATSEPKRQAKSRSKKVYSQSKTLSRSDQEALWDQRPSTSDHVPGVLSLCQGMPVLIRYNDATELCITRGQEAVVVGWTFSWVDQLRERKRLEVLYVKLVNPPRDVYLPNLPVNVVPLTRMAQTIDARLPSDLYMRVSRSQVPVLPYFAMTDYSAQGKTRKLNVVDLKNCKNFQAAYTCLSRGTSLAGTVILRDFPTTKLKGSIDGELRQEYRELNYLDVITELRYGGDLPEDIVQSTRWATLRRYKAWAKPGVESSWHPMIRDSTAMDNTDGLDVDPNFGPYGKANKRKSTNESHKNPKRPKRTTTSTATWGLPVGPVWDSLDYSCAYDVWTAIIYSVWKDYTAVTDAARDYSDAMAVLIGALDGMEQVDPALELTSARDAWRATVREGNPNQYPVGTAGADMYYLSEDLLGTKTSTTRSSIEVRCLSCRWKGREEVGARTPAHKYFILDESVTIQDFVDKVNYGVGRCPMCGQLKAAVFDAPHLVAFELRHTGEMELNRRYELPLRGTYRLAGVIYFGAFHFVCRVVTAGDKVYMHDGMRGTYTMYEGTLQSFQQGRQSLLECNGKRASIAIYVLEG